MVKLGKKNILTYCGKKKTPFYAFKSEILII